MKLVYTPKGGDRKVFEFEPLDMRNADAEAIEQHTGMTFMEWGEKLAAGSFTALHGLLFVLLRADDPGLQWGAVDFSMGELDFETDEEEPPKAGAPAVTSVKSGPRRSLAS